MKKNYFVVGILSAIFLILFLNLVAPNAHASTILSINRMQSGLVASDPLNNETETQQQLQTSTGYWRYGGDAISENAPYDFYRDAQGLHIGVQSPSNGTYAGFYAITPNTDALLFHSVISAPLRTTPTQQYENGMYVQTIQAPVNYVTCVAVTNNQGTVWEVVHTYGAPTQSLVFATLWTDSSPNQPLTRDCTIITNGNNYLKVYLDGVMVYSNNMLVLGMPSPFNAYLEPESSYQGQLLNGTFTDFYITSNETIQVTDNPSNAKTVSVTDSSGNILASAPVTGGNAVLDIGKYHFPLAGTINVYDSSNTIIASTSGPVNIFGGDVYSVSSPTAPQPPTNLTSSVISSSQINLSWIAPVDDGGSPITGYKIERSLDSSSIWNTVVPNTGNTDTTYSDTGLSSNTTYTYRVSSINSAGTSSPSNTSSATTDASAPAIVLNNIKSTSGSASVPSFQITLDNFNAGIGNNRVLVVGVGANNDDVASITFGGVPLTKKVQSFVNDDAEFWYLKNPNGTANIVVTMAGPTSTVVGAYAFSGVDQSNPMPVSIIKHNTSASSPTISITTAYPNDWVLDLPSIYGGKTLDSPTCTQEWNLNVLNLDTGNITSASSSTVVPSPSSTSCSWTASNGGDLWDDIAIEVKAFANAG
ncbi:MAG TPA: fibronectin type III domain-containing protein [Candidatus Nitrosotalea sp.]|nr:fibronectin type III domain-containing protein [Nitrososphaerota archaeon]HKU33408.1 fibronectin type III domain-containing protein [Candidatus Nitrosotalea sp.]